MANKQYLIELAVKDTKLKSSLKRALENPEIQKQLGILGEGITEHLEKDVDRATSILGKVDWASLLGTKDFEHLQQLVAKTVSANKDLIKSFAKTGDVKGIQDAIELVSTLGSELKAINPGETVAGLASSMASFMKAIKPLSGKFKELIDAPDMISASFGNMTGNINKQLESVQKRAAKVIESMNSQVLSGVKSKIGTLTYQKPTEELEQYVGELKDADAMIAELNKEIEASQTLLRKINSENGKINTDRITKLVQHEQKINALVAKLGTIHPSVDGDVMTRDVKATIQKVSEEVKKTINKTLEDKLTSVKITIDVPTEDKLIADINSVIDKVNVKGISKLKVVGVEAAINESQKNILNKTLEWREEMKKALKFDKKEDITLDLGVKMRDIGSDVGDQLRRSIEEYFEDPTNKVSVPVELVMSDKNKTVLEGGNITINGGSGGGEITAESLAKALTTPIEVKVQEEQQKQKPSGKLISLKPDSAFANEVLDVFDQIFDAIERGGENAKKISEFFKLKGLDLPTLKGKGEMDILSAFESFLERGDKSVLDDVETRLTKGSTKNKATLAFADLLRDSIFRFNLDHITSQEDVKRRQVKALVEEDYIPRSKAQESIYNIRNTKAKDYKLPTVEELNALMTTLPNTWGKLGEDFLPALKSLKQLRDTITDPTNATEIKRFQEAADAFALNTDSLYREMSDFMHGYKIGVFNKGHNKHNKYFDYSVGGGVFSGSKLASNLDKVDYFELYDDPSGHFSRGNRKDAMDSSSSLDRYQLRRDSRNAPYRTKEPERTSVLAEDVKVEKFEPKKKAEEKTKEINEHKEAAEKRAKALEEARKASAEEAKAAEELRKQQLETDKKRRTALKGQRTKTENKLKNATSEEEKLALQTKNTQLTQEIAELDKRISENSIEPTKTPTAKQQLENYTKDAEIPKLREEIDALDKKIEVAQQETENVEKFVEKHFKAEKKPTIDYTKSENNNKDKRKYQAKRLDDLNSYLTDKKQTSFGSTDNMTDKDMSVVSNLLNDRKIYQMINGDGGLALPQNSNLENAVRARIQAYSNNFKKIDDFILKHNRSIQSVSNNSELTEFMKDDSVRHVMAGTFKGSKEDETAIKTKINEFKARMVESGKSYVADYIDMWSDSRLRQLMKDNETRTKTDVKGDSILQEFYRRIVEGGVSKRGEAYQYLKDESAKYQKNVTKDEGALAKLVTDARKQVETTSDKDVVANERVKEEYRKYITQWLQNIQTNMTDISSDEISSAEKALKVKKNDEFRGLISDFANKYFKEFGEKLLTEDQTKLLNASKTDYQTFLRDNESKKVESVVAERNQKQQNIEAIISEKSKLLEQRRIDLLNRISSNISKGKDTKSLEATLTEVENELVQYSNVPVLLKEQFEADLLNAKNANDDDWKKFSTKVQQRKDGEEAAKYKSLQDKQQSILNAIAQKTKAGESTVELEKSLEAINKEILKYEVNASRLNDIEFAKFPNDASVATIRTYNSEMEKLVTLQQQRALLEAQGASATEKVKKDREIANQKRTLKRRVGTQIEEDKKADAKYAPANQAAEFIKATDRALYVLEEQTKKAAGLLDTASRNLATMQGDEYKNSGIYRDRIESLKNQDVSEYVRSDEYRSARQKGVEQADKEFGAYLTEKLGEDVAKRIVYEFAQNGDRANVDDILDGSGNTTRLVENAFESAMADARKNYMGSDAYAELLAQYKKGREDIINAELKGEKDKTDAKVKEIWNATKADIEILRHANMANSEELRTAVYAEAEKAGMGDSSEYRRSIVDQVREDLIRQRIEAGKKEQKFYNEQYYEKARQRRSELSPAMYQEIDKKVEQVVYDTVMSKIQGLVGDNKDLLKGLEAKRKEIMEANVGGIVEQYRNSLRMEETGMYKGANVREMIEKELANEVAYYEQKYIESSGKLGILKNERARAESFGKLGYDDTLNPEIAQARAEAEVRLSAEKEKQVALTERLTNLTAQNADQKIVQSVAAELQTTEKEIARLQLLAEGAAEALSLRKTEREEEFEEKKITPEKQRLWYIDAIEREKKKLESGTDEQKAKAEGNIAKWEQKLANIEKIIEESKPEAEKPKTVLDMITNAIRQGLAGVTAGGTVDLDASLYNIATETTLQEILRLLGGNGAVDYANQLKKELAKYRPRYERRSSEGEGTNGNRTSGGKNTRVNKDLGKLNADGQRIFGELEAEAKLFTNSLKNGGKQYAADFDFVKAIKDQAAVVKKQTKGTLEYVKEQTKLTTLYQDYYKKTFGAGRRKKGQPGQAKWAEQGELGKIAGLKDLLLFKSNRADALVGLNYGVKSTAKVDEPTVKDKPNKTNKKKQASNDDYKVDVTAKDGIKNAMAEYRRLVKESFEYLQQDLERDAKVSGDKARAILSQLDAQLSNPVASEAIENLRNNATLVDEVTETLEGVQNGTANDADEDASDTTKAMKNVIEETLAAKGTKADAEDIADLGKMTSEAIAKAMADAGLGRDKDDDILASKGEFAKVLYDAIIDAYKMVASGKGMHAETSYGIDEFGNVIDVQRGTMLSTTGAQVGSTWGHTHATDVLFSGADFEAARKYSGLFDVLELITPLTKYRITGLKNINPDELAAKFQKLSELADQFKNAPDAIYNMTMKSAIAARGLNLESIPTELAPSQNFQKIRNASLLQTASNHELSLISFEKTLYAFVKELQTKNYEFDQSSPLGKLVESIETIHQSEYDNEYDKEDALEDLRPLLESVFGKNPDAQISVADRENVFKKLMLSHPYLGAEIDERGEELAARGLHLFGDGKTLWGDKGGYKPYDGFGRDSDVKTAVKDGVKEGVSESKQPVTSDKKIPYDVDPNSLIGRLQNTVGGETGALAKQATLALVLSELQAINKKVPTIGKSGVKSSAQHLLEEFQKMAEGSALDSKERVSYFDAVNGAMSPALSGATHSVSQKLIDTLSQQYGVDKGYRSQVHTHADSEQTWFSAKDLDHFKKNLGDFGVDSIKQQVLLTKDSITVFDMTMVETAEKAALAIDILKKAGSNVDDETLEKLTELGARYQSKDLGAIGAKGLMDLLGVKNYHNDDKQKAKTDKVSNETTNVTAKKVQQYRAEIQNAKQELLLSDGDDSAFVAAEKEVDKLVEQINGGKLNGQALTDTINEFEIARQRAETEGKKLHKLILKNDRLRGGTAEVRQAVTQGTRVRSLVGDAIETYDKDGLQLFGVDDDAPKYLRDYVAEYNNLIEKQQQYIKDGTINNPKIQDALKVQTAGVKKLGIEAMAAYKNTQRLQEASANSESQTYKNAMGVEHVLGGSKAVSPADVNRNTMKQYAKEVLGADLASVKLNTTTGKLTGVLRKNNYVVADMVVEYDKATGQLHLYQEKERESLGGLPGFINGLKAKSKALVQYMFSMTSIYRVLGELRKGIQYIREIDKALTELKKVTDKTDETYQKFLKTAAQTADELGSTISQVTEATATFAKLGYTMEMATEMAEAAIVYKNVGDNIASTEDAADSIISTLKGFRLEASETMRIVDRFNEVGNNFAITSQGIGEALKLSASALNEGANSLDESIALITAANEVVRFMPRSHSNMVTRSDLKRGNS